MRSGPSSVFPNLGDGADAVLVVEVDEADAPVLEALPNGVG